MPNMTTNHAITYTKIYTTSKSDYFIVLSNDTCSISQSFVAITLKSGYNKEFVTVNGATLQQSYQVLFRFIDHWKLC